MSFLQVPRLHMIGGFWTDPSSVNNDPVHYDPTSGPPSPWQMPAGNHYFKFQNCTICTVLDDQGNPVTNDPVLGAPFVSTDLYVTPPMGQATSPIPPCPAKIVDIDVYQQGVSTLYGIQIQLTVGGQTITGNLSTPPSLNSTWFGHVLPTRGWNVGGGVIGYGDDTDAVGTFQTQICIPAADWKVTGSPALEALKNSTLQANGMIYLSFKFVLDAYINTYAGAPEANCYTGRMVGTIGPVTAGEPIQTAGARWLVPRTPPDIPGKEDPWFYPKFYGAPFRVDSTRKVLTIDLAASMTTQTVGGALVDLGSLFAVVTPPNQTDVVLGEVSYDSFQYNATAGITEIALTDDQLALVSSAPLTLRTSRTDIGNRDVLVEDPSGLWWAVDQRVFRIDSDVANPEAGASTNVFVTQWGRPAPNVQLNVEVVSVHGTTPGATVPPTNKGDTPQADGALAATLTASDSNGVAKLSLQAVRDCGSRTPWLDSQLYFVNVYGKAQWSKSGQIQEQQASVLQFSLYPVKTAPVWADISAMMTPYQVLYPAMSNTRVDLTDEHSFVIFSWNPNWWHAYGFPQGYSVPPGITGGAIPLYLTRAIDDPRFMPVSRDLSPNKIRTILNFIMNNPPAPVSGDSNGGA